MRFGCNFNLAEPRRINKLCGIKVVNKQAMGRLHCQLKSLELRKIKRSDETGVTIPLYGIKEDKGLES